MAMHPAEEAGRRSASYFRDALGRELDRTVLLASLIAEDWGLDDAGQGAIALGMGYAPGFAPAYRGPGHGSYTPPYDGLVHTTLAADRKRFAKELEANPALKEKIFGIGAGENQDPKANLAVMESMMNRASVRGTSLAEAARLYGRERGGYYAGYNPGGVNREMSEANLAAALAGSNVSNYATDNSSGNLAARERASGSFTFQQGYNGESFFSPGSSGGRAGSQSRAAYERWRSSVAGGETKPYAATPGPHTLGGLMHDQPRSANFMRGQYGAPGQNLTTVTTAGGKNVVVNRASAPAFEGFLNEIEGAGAPLHSLGGYSYRSIAGSGRLSQHAYGNAIDIDQHSRDVVDRDFANWARANPEALRSAQNRWGIISGGDWSRPDFGHFEWSGARPWEQQQPPSAVASGP